MRPDAMLKIETGPMGKVMRLSAFEGYQRPVDIRYPRGVCYKRPVCKRLAARDD